MHIAPTTAPSCAYPDIDILSVCSKNPPIKFHYGYIYMGDVSE